MMHGRAGAYSSAAKGVYDASTLSQRHQFWGRLWAALGYIGVLVDGFGPRGYPQGFGRFTYDSRPAELDEVSIRPLDAYGALAYLRSRPDISQRLSAGFFMMEEDDPLSDLWMRDDVAEGRVEEYEVCLLYTSPSPRD